MTHLSEERLNDLVETALEPTADERAHLALCVQCHTRLESMSTLIDELALLRAAEPTADERERYYALFDQVVHSPSRLQRTLASVRLTLTWDTRHRTAAVGVRSAGELGYRLLYEATTSSGQDQEADQGESRGDTSAETAQAAVSLPTSDGTQTDEAEIELMVTADGPRRLLVGEFSTAMPVTALTVMLTSEAGEAAPPRHFDEDGRFQLPGVSVGRYQMTLTTDTARTYIVEGLEIT